MKMAPTTRFFSYFKLNDHEEFYKFVSMSVDQSGRLTKNSRRALSPELKLCAVLHLLTHGLSVQKVSWMYLIGRSTMYNYIHEVCTAICDAMKENYIAFPSQEDFSIIAEYYGRRWNMPNCIAALDGKHIRLKCPENSGLYFYNYKKYFSLVLLALTDAFCRFLWINIGDFGSLNDAGIFQWSDLGRALNEGNVDLPQPFDFLELTLSCHIISLGMAHLL